MTQALEEGEDLQELSERARERKDRSRGGSRRDVDSIDSPAADIDTPRGRKGRKGKGKAIIDDSVTSGKRKRGGGKATSVTPSIQDDDDDDRDTVKNF